MTRRRIDWKDRAAGYETPSERFCRHNGIPYRGGCGSLDSATPAPKAARHARAQAIVTLLARKPMPKLTDTNIKTLVRLRDGRGWKTPMRSTMGGAIRRMLDRLADAGLIAGPPFEITELGIERLRRLGK